MVTIGESGPAAFRIYLPHADYVELIGDFTGWQESPVAMRRDEDGWWSADVEVGPGEHRFSYMVDGMYWMPDYAADGVEHTDFGRWVSRLRVPRVSERMGARAVQERPTPGRGVLETPGVSVLRERGVLGRGEEARESDPPPAWAR